jgi:quinol monooxygenase YgiN
MVKVGLYVRLEAAAGKEDAVADFLRSAQSLVEQEPDTVVWYALQLGPSTFAILDAFEDDGGRRAHLDGAVAQGLGDNADLFAKPPEIHEIDVLAATGKP